MKLDTLSNATARVPHNINAVFVFASFLFFSKFFFKRQYSPSLCKNKELIAKTKHKILTVPFV